MLNYANTANMRGRMFQNETFAIVEKRVYVHWCIEML